MKELIVNYPIDVPEVMKKYQLHMDSLVNYQIGNDDQVYLLINDHIPERINGMFVDSESSSNYFVLVLTVDWIEGEVLHDELLPLGKLRGNYHYVQPIGEHLLLVGARAHNTSPVPEQNAVVISRQGKIQYELCLGDGINDCIVNCNNEIITSYFDEGVLGNYGWRKPIGRNGIIRWNANGDILWDAKDYGIIDCYAINIDSKDNLWFYYYPHFCMVSTDYRHDATYHPEIRGARAFLITSNSQSILFDGGYNMYGHLISVDIIGSELDNYQEVNVVYNGRQLTFTGYSFRSSKAVLIDTEQQLYVKDVMV